MQPPVQGNTSTLSAAPTMPISIDIGALSTYNTAGPCQCLRCCAARTPAPPYIDWARLWAVGRRAAAAILSGINYCARTIAATAPAAFGFYGATMGISVSVGALALHDSWLRCAVELRPLCYGHVNGLVVICATAYAVDSAARDRKRRGLSTGLLGIASRVMCMTTALGAASCGLGSLAHHLAYTDALRERWWHYSIDNRYERGMVDGIVLCGIVAIAVASAVIVFQSPHKAVTDTRRALARIIDVDPTPTAHIQSESDVPTRADLGDLLLPLRDTDQERADADAEPSQS